eukprot:666117-Rhodomonas_salina.1
MGKSLVFGNGTRWNLGLESGLGPFLFISERDLPGHASHIMIPKPCLESGSSRSTTMQDSVVEGLG